MAKKKNANVDPVETVDSIPAEKAAEKVAEVAEAPVKKATRRTHKKAASDTTDKTAVEVVDIPAEKTADAETPLKKTRSKNAKTPAAEKTTEEKPAEDNTTGTKAETVIVPIATADIAIDTEENTVTVTNIQPLDSPAPTVVAKTPKRTAKRKDTAPVLATILQVGDKEFDITNIAETALKAYKSVHKRKNVTDFVIYIKPEDNAAYYTVNGEGAEDYKVEL